MFDSGYPGATTCNPGEISILKMESSFHFLAIKSIHTIQRYKNKRLLKSSFTINWATNMILIVQLLSVALASDDMITSLTNSTRIDEKTTEKTEILSDQSRPRSTTNDIDLPPPKLTTNSGMEHSHSPSKSKLTGPFDLKVNTTTPNSITLQWRLNPEMENKIFNYRVYYVHENYPDVKTIKAQNHGPYELTGLGRKFRYDDFNHNKILRSKTLIPVNGKL